MVDVDHLLPDWLHQQQQYIHVTYTQSGSKQSYIHLNSNNICTEIRNKTLLITCKSDKKYVISKNNKTCHQDTTFYWIRFNQQHHCDWH